MLLVPPTPPVLDQLVIHVRAVRQQNIGYGALVPVGVVSLNRHGSTKDHGGRGPLRDLAERLALLGTIDALQADTLSLPIVQDFNGVPIEDADDLAREGEGFTDADENEQSEKGRVSHAGTICKRLGLI